MDITIEKATPDDLKEVSGLLAKLFTIEKEFTPDPELQKHGVHLLINNPSSGLILVARYESKIIGMVSIQYLISTALGARVALMEDMFVLEKYRKSGVGTKLIDAVIKEARSNHCKRITLLTDNDNETARSFYIKTGFQRSEMEVFRVLL